MILSPPGRRFRSSGKSYKKRAFLRFLIAGSVNTIFGYSVFCLVLWMSGRSMVALILGTIFGTLFSFFTIGTLVFRQAKPQLLWRFVAVYAFVFLCNAVGLLIFERSGFTPVVAQAFVLPFIVVLSYFLNENVVFGGAR